VAGDDSVPALALRFLILTATRTSEALQAQWNEIDLETTVWTVPAERMKARREHRVPLSDAAMSILKALPRIEDNPYLYLFPGTRHGHPLCNMAIRGKLGWEPGCLNRDGGKPKGMHWNTFERLTAQHDAFVQTSLARIAARYRLPLPW